jgi:putative SOS response-associated peptidase YedK
MMIVRAADEFTGQIHDRMPVMLAPEQIEPWLSGSTGSDEQRTRESTKLCMWPVSTPVNKIGNDDRQSLSK